MPIRPAWGTSLGSGRPTVAIEHTGSPTVAAAAMRCAADTAVADVYQVVVACAVPPVEVVGRGVGRGVTEVGPGVAVGTGSVPGVRVGARVPEGGVGVGRPAGGVVRAGACVVGPGDADAFGSAGAEEPRGGRGVRVGAGRVSGAPVAGFVAGVLVAGFPEGVRPGVGRAPGGVVPAAGGVVLGLPGVVCAGFGEVAPEGRGPVVPEGWAPAVREGCGCGAAGDGAADPGVVRWGDGRPLGGAVPAAGGVVLGAPGCVPAGLREGVREGVRDGFGDAVPGVSGPGVRDVCGRDVGRDRSTDLDGEGRGVPSFDATHAHTPMPPRTTTAAPPAIHGARLDGRR